MLIEVKDMTPYLDSFLFHWENENGDVVLWENFEHVQECVKWCAFCLRCGAANSFCSHGITYKVGSGEANNHAEALHMLNVMSLNHIVCQPVGVFKEQIAS